MKKIELSGILEMAWHNWDKIKIVQEDGYKIDLIGRFMEAAENNPYKKVQVNYWITDERCTKNEMTAGLLNQIVGGLDAEYNKYDFSYSSVTHDTSYDSTLRIGGHDLFNELKSEMGRFIIIEINFQD